MEFDDIQKQILQDFNRCLGKRLTIFRELRKFSKKKFADKLGISVEELEMYESGKDSIPFSLLLLSTEILSISLNHFFGKGSELNNGRVKTNFIRTLFSLKKEIK